jgi:hypothetical protein
VLQKGMECLFLSLFPLQEIKIYSYATIEGDNDKDDDNIIIIKYEDFMIVIKCMWNVKANVIPVIIGVTGTISKSLSQYLSNIPVKHEIKELQKTVILGTANILWKVLN